MADTDALRSLPSVHRLLAATAPLIPEVPHALLVREVRNELDAARESALGGKPFPTSAQLAHRIAGNLRQLQSASLRPVINATGVVLHTNLGRAPLGNWNAIPGYSNLEYDLLSGRRGRRDAHLTPLFEALLGKPAIAVNNGAAATFLALHELAAGFEVIVSRGELIEIGDGFRIPDILTRSGAVLRDVGTTNRTRIEDYQCGITSRTRLILRVHPSNFHIGGFTAKPTLAELVALGKQHGIPVYEDLGSGNLVDLKQFGVSEPLVSASLASGVNLVSFSGDKLLGGPQAGILTGDADLIERLRRNPLFRALRLDKLIYQALEDTIRKILFEDWEAIPALKMIRMSSSDIAQRARLLLPDAELMEGASVIGGGSTPDQSIPTTLIVAARTHSAQAEKFLRRNHPPVIARITDDLLLVDLRTVFPSEEADLRDAILAL